MNRVPVKLLCAWAAIFMCTALHASPVKYFGRVVSSGKGVPDVSVTDGRSVVRTDHAGRYVLESDGNAEFVYISVPSGYTVPLENNAPCFYRNVSDEEKEVLRVDFEISATMQDETRHMFFLWADVQVYEPEEVRYVEKAAADVRHLVESSGLPAVGVTCGDIIGEWNYTPSLFMPVMAATSQSGVPFYCAVGNHDMDMDARSNEGSKRTFKSLFGPTYYSFNKGKVHYVVLDNVFYLALGYRTVGYIEETQLRWLENDLAYVPDGSTVVVCMHIPAYSRAARHKEWGKEELNKITCNRNALYDILEPYNAHLLTAHEHYAENYVMSDRLFEHVHPPLSGLFWQSKWSMDGVPWGYMVYEIDGDDVSWYYKPVGGSREDQFYAYPAGADPARPDCVTANVWNYDPAWKVCWYEDGEFKGEMTRYSGWDRTICEDVEARREKEFKWKYIGAGETEHLFYAKPSSPEAVITVEVTDRFGNVYRKDL